MAGYSSSREIQKRVWRGQRAWFVVLASACLLLAAGVVLGLLAGGRFNATAETPENFRVAPETLSASFAEVSKRVEPAVVNIDTKGKVPEVSLKGEQNSEPTNPDDILEYFKRQLPRRPAYSVGSGFIVDKTGYILTNFHVIDDASRISVRLQNGEEYVAKIIGTDEETDLAVLKVEAGKDLPTVKLGDSDAVQVGDWVLAIGSPFGLAQTVTAGIISQTRRETPYTTSFQRFIQTDAAINRGNSGGPLVNMNGDVIGVNSQIASTTGDYNGIGFALPSKEAAYVYRQILANGKVRRGYLGVNLDSVKPEFAKVYDLGETKGAFVTDIRDRTGAAAKAGLQINDIITEFNGEPVAGAQDLIAKVSATEPQKEINIVYLREAGDKLERRTTVIKLGERPSNNPNAATTTENDSTRRKLSVNPDANNTPLTPFGLTLAEMTPQMATTYKLEGQTGLVIKSIDPASFIADLKTASGADALNAGDLIQRINRTSVTDLKTFNDITGKLKTGDAVVLHVSSYNRFTHVVQQRIVQFTVQ
ncbi:MAG TPA: trypsin-like peptidase domain-containing protein [Pyrinomonadaceae bacterium]|nr:trypsin-like peptidase domain-containing protein [Pyrinomonadaceae bacterium]